MPKNPTIEPHKTRDKIAKEVQKRLGKVKRELNKELGIKLEVYFDFPLP